MTSVLYSPPVDHRSHSRTGSPMESARPASALAYWRPEPVPRDYHHYSPYRPDMQPHHPIESSRHHDSYRRSSNNSTPHPSPSIDFSGLIPMYAEPGSPDRGGPIDLPPYDAGASAASDWPTSNMAQYAAFQRANNHHASKPPALWPPHDMHSQHQQQWTSPSDYRGGADYTLQSYHSPPSPYSSSGTTSSSSSSTPPAYFLSGPPASAPPPTLNGKRGAGAAPDGAKKSCFHCHVTSTPLWRRDPASQRPLCNACGLYLQQRNKLRPQELIDADIDDPDDEANRIPDSEYTGPKCSHCLTRQTSVWRRSKTGAQVCNACGVYARLRGKERPLSLRRNKIKPRTKHLR
ncbi:hypothetical protein C8J57DRAFT_1278421 [Mycena rebaudengoi]|nr:hypothetical protein C8J57DRAFT_1278421 [Mycena rebaudengoi]